MWPTGAKRSCPALSSPQTRHILSLLIWKHSGLKAKEPLPSLFLVAELMVLQKDISHPAFLKIIPQFAPCDLPLSNRCHLFLFNERERAPYQVENGLNELTHLSSQFLNESLCFLILRPNVCSPEEKVYKLSVSAKFSIRTCGSEFWEGGLLCHYQWAPY